MSANPTTVLVPSTGDVHPYLDQILEGLARGATERDTLLGEVRTLKENRTVDLAEIAKLRTQLEENAAERAEMKITEGRLRAFDALQQGEKRYGGAATLGTREARIDRAYDLFGETIHDIACLSYGRELKFGHIKPHLRDQTLASGPAGGSVVPYPILTEISVLQEKFGLARRLCGFVQMTAHKMGKNAFGSDAAGSYPNENAAPAATDELLRSPRGELEAKLFVVNMKVSMQLDLDAPAGLQRYWIDRMLTVAGLEEDRVFLTANNSPSPWYGVLAHASVPEYVCATQTYDGIIAKEVLAVIHQISKHVRGKATFIMSPDIFGVLQGLEDTQGRPIWAPMGAAISNTIYGHGYEDSPVMPDHEAVLGDEKDKPFIACGSWKDAAIFGDRMTTAIDFDRSVHFTAAAIAMRMITDFGVYFVQPTACARGRTAP